MNRKINLLMVFLLISIISLADAHILVYHRFGDERHKTSNIDIDKLKKDFQYLKDNNYEVVELEKIVSKIEKDEKIPDNWIALTIDDAYKTFYTNGLAVFKEFDYPFTMFVNTQAVNDGYGDFMSWQEIEEISKYGSIGSHSHSHPHSTKLTEEQLKKDLSISKKLLSENYKGKIEFYTHPYGEYNDEVLETVKTFAFRAIFNQTNGAISHKSNKYDLNRIAIGNEDNLAYWLRVKYLDADWEEFVVENNIIKKLKIKVDEKIDKLEVYVSGYSWEWHEVKDGYLTIESDLKLNFSRNRIMIKTSKNEWSSYLYVK